MIEEHLTSNALEARLIVQIEPTLQAMGFDLVRLTLQGRETPTLQIMADRADGSLITIEECEQISHAVGAILDVEDPIPNAWSLEVSSAGIDRPLTRLRDWARFAGHLAKAELSVPLENRKRFTGTIVGVQGEAALLRLEGGEEVALPLANMYKARLVLTDALIAASASMAGLQESKEESGTRKRRTPKLFPSKPGKKTSSGRRPSSPTS